MFVGCRLLKRYTPELKKKENEVFIPGGAWDFLRESYRIRNCESEMEIESSFQP